MSTGCIPVTHNFGDNILLINWKRDIQEGNLIDRIPSSLYTVICVCNAGMIQQVSLESLEALKEWLETVAIPEGMEWSGPMEGDQSQWIFVGRFDAMCNLAMIRHELETR